MKTQGFHHIRVWCGCGWWFNPLKCGRLKEKHKYISSLIPIQQLPCSPWTLLQEVALLETAAALAVVKEGQQRLGTQKISTLLPWQGNIYHLLPEYCPESSQQILDAFQEALTANPASPQRPSSAAGAALLPGCTSLVCFDLLVTIFYKLVLYTIGT